jgi:hypothetical protein
MRFLLSIAAAALLAGPALAQKDAASPIVPRRGIPKAPRLPKMGPPLSNPGSPVARLYRASQDERERALEKLPMKMQQQFRNQLARFDAMPKPQQEVAIRRAERFAAMSPEEKATVMRQMATLAKLKEERRREIGLAIRRMQPLSEEDRQKLTASDEFKARFSAEERQIVADLTHVMTPPN